MPKLPQDYSKSIIYKIYCNDKNITEVYVGSTTNFKQRKNKHKGNCNSEKNDKYNMRLYKIIRDNGGWDNYSMIPIIEYPCENKIQLLIKEEEYRKELNAQLNSCKCIIISHTDSMKESYQKRKGKIDKDKVKEYNRQYKEQNKDALKEKNKLYYEKHKENLVQKSRNFYEKNKDVINEKRRKNPK